MSQMSKLERHARTATAMSLLNEVRHYVTGRQQRPLSEDHVQILCDAIDLSQAHRPTGKMLRYSFRGLRDRSESAALELSEAILAALVRLGEEGQDWSKYVESLRMLLDSQGKIDPENRKRVEQFTMVAMDIIGAESRERSDTTFTASVI
jgi:hypothetical protein